jgi:hypothetical protein
LHAGIVEAFDAIENVRARVAQGHVVLAVDPFALDHAEEAFGRCVVGAVTDRTHAAADVVVGEQAANLWHQRWRVFWMACAKLFGFDGGNEWLAGHYRFQRRPG